MRSKAIIPLTADLAEKSKCGTKTIFSLASGNFMQVYTNSAIIAPLLKLQSFSLNNISVRQTFLKSFSGTKILGMVKAEKLTAPRARRFVLIIYLCVIPANDETAAAVI